MPQATTKPGDEDIHQRRQASVYDAVAGRVGYQGFLPGHEVPSRFRDTATNSTLAVPPDEALFRRREAPLRFEEDDLYAADRHLEPHQRLPDSDLLKTIHAYVSDFYARAAPDGGKHDVRSLDETALLAMGFLLEEAAAEALGRTGDLALVEDAAADHASSRPSTTDHLGLMGRAALRESVIDRSRGVAQFPARSRSTKQQASDTPRSSLGH